MTDLPERIRTRVVALVADALPSVTPLPPALKRVADFAPARRAKLGGTAIWTSLSDDEFRGHAAVQVAARTSGTSEDPAEVGALAWLAREEGWEDAVADAVRRLSEAGPAGSGTDAELQRLRDQVTALQQDLRDARATHKTRLDEVKAENATLRRKLGDTRSTLRAAEADRAVAQESLAEATRSAAQAVGKAETESRRLRAQLDEALADRTAERRDAKSGRDAATVRTRYLLDTVIEAATGLRRELALPAVTGAPGDALESELRATEGTRTPSRSGSLGTASPAALEQLLALPRVRLIVDGYNVSKTAWPSSSLEAQRIRLLNGLAPLVARTGAETTVVFDAAASPSRPVVTTPRGVKVIFSPEGVIADDVIRDLVAAEPTGRVVAVVSSDLELTRDVTRDGARALAAEALIGVIGG